MDRTSLLRTHERGNSCSPEKSIQNNPQKSKSTQQQHSRRTDGARTPDFLGSLTPLFASKCWLRCRGAVGQGSVKTAVRPPSVFAQQQRNPKKTWTPRTHIDRPPRKLLSARKITGGTKRTHIAPCHSLLPPPEPASSAS